MGGPKTVEMGREKAMRILKKTKLIDKKQKEIARKVKFSNKN